MKDQLKKVILAYIKQNKQNKLPAFRATIKKNKSEVFEIKVNRKSILLHTILENKYKHLAILIEEGYPLKNEPLMIIDQCEITLFDFLFSLKDENIDHALFKRFKQESNENLIDGKPLIQYAIEKTNFNLVKLILENEEVDTALEIKSNEGIVMQNNSSKNSVFYTLYLLSFVIRYNLRDTKKKETYNDALAIENAIKTYRSNRNEKMITQAELVRKLAIYIRHKDYSSFNDDIQYIDVNYINKPLIRIISDDVEQKYTLLFFAIILADLNSIERLIKHGASIYTVIESEGFTCLQIAINNNKEAIAQYFLNLHESYKKGNIIQRPDDYISDYINYQNKRNGLTALHIALYKLCSKSLLNDLIKKGANIKLLDANSWLPLHTLLAKKNFDPDVLKLVATPELINYTDGKAQTPFMYAFKLKPFNINNLKTLFEIGADPNKTIRPASVIHDGFENITHYMKNIPTNDYYINFFCQSNILDNQFMNQKVASSVSSIRKSIYPFDPGLVLAIQYMKGVFNYSNPLLLAIHLNLESAVNLLLERDVDIDSRDYSLSFKLNHLSSAETKFPIFKHINKETDEADLYIEITPLILSIIMKKDSMTRMLIKKGASLNQTIGPNAITPLMLSVLVGSSIDIFLLLLLKKTDFTEEDITYLICFSVIYGRVNYLIILLNKFEGYINSDIFYGYTPLYLAILFDKQDIIDVLINRNADLDRVCSVDNLSPLFLATYCQNEITVKKLIDGGATLVNNQLDEISPIYKAVLTGSLNMVKLLTNKDTINLQHENKLMLTPLHYAIIGKKIHILLYLLKMGADPNLQSISGKKPKDLADELGFGEDFKLLLDRIKNNVNKPLETQMNDDIVIFQPEKKLNGVTFLKEQGYSYDEIQMLKQPAEKENDHPNIKEEKNIIYTWQWNGKTLSSKMHEVEEIRKANYTVFFYLDEKSILEQGCPETLLKDFKKHLPKFGATESDNGLTRICGTFFYKNKFPLKQELKLLSTPDRIGCIKIKELGKPTLYIGALYIKNGFHNKNNLKPYQGSKGYTAHSTSCGLSVKSKRN